MPFDLSMNPNALSSQVADAQAAQLLKRSQAAAAATPADPKEEAKITKAGKDFETMLLSSWLQKAEQSFATVPGGDEDEDADAGKDQFQGIAMQALAGSLTASGGIGIAKMITEHLQASAEKEQSTKTSGAASSGNKPFSNE